MWNRLELFDIGRIFKNSMLLFTTSRYIQYGLQFIRGVLVAKFLGPYLFGVWGFLLLAQQYLSYTNFGLQYAINVPLATDLLYKPKEREEIINVALILTSIFAGILILAAFGIQYFTISIFEKYSFNQYVLILGIIAGLNHLERVLMNVHRIYKNLARIAGVGLFRVFLLLLIPLIFRKDILIVALLVGMIFCPIVSIIVYMIRVPFHFNLSLNKHYVKLLLSFGIPLLIFNVTFYMITISAQTIISIFYSVEVMGYYTLANNIAAATMLGLNTVIWVIYPDILKMTREGLDDEVVARTVQKFTDIYSTAVFLVAFGTILILPALFWILPQYKPVQATINVLLLSQAVLSLCCGYTYLAVARKKQLVIARMGMVALALVVGLALAVGVLKLHYIWIAISVLAGTFVFSLLQVKIGSRLIKDVYNQKSYLKNILPYGTLLSIFLFLTGSILGNTYLGGLAGLVVFIISSMKKLALLYTFGLEKIKRPL